MIVDETDEGTMERSDEHDKPRAGLTYRDAGVDIDAQDEALRRIKDLVRGTRTAGVLADLGCFGGLFVPALDGMAQPVLVSSADGVGTKLRIAFRTGIHNTVGRDLVQHCINDILVQGARPMFFMDYVATGRLDPRVLAEVVEGIAAACKEQNCALLGGETAEMPGFYGDDEYDVAGFIVGLVDRDRILDGSRVTVGDRLIGLPSRGLHTNGYSLARKIFFELAGLDVADRVDELSATVGETLLAEHLCYLNPLSLALDEGWLHALAHITGGGLTDNLPRVLPEGTAVSIERGSWPVLPVFEYMQRVGDVADDEMFRTFNMGIGMVAICGPNEGDLLESHLDRIGQPHYRIGEVIAGDGRVRYAG
jgi:phosphoribosylformylglycinamidine cyclo-ligase